MLSSSEKATQDAAPLTLLSIVIPARNEEGCIVSTVQHLHIELELRGVPHEIIVVDDGSSDQTWPLLQQQAQCIPELRPVQNLGRHGFGRAIIYGIDQMKGDAAVIMMADESDDCRDAVLYWKKLNEGYDCVFGSRFTAGGGVIDYPWFKLVVNRIANTFIRVLFNFRLNDTTNAFKAYRKTVLDGCRPFLSAHFNLTVELPLKAIVRGFTWTTMPITWRNRRSGEAKLKIKEMGSRYLFICLYLWLEKYFSCGDYCATPRTAGPALEPSMRPRRFPSVPVILFAIALILYLSRIAVGWHHTITDMHAFRQCQTAISTFYIVKDLAVGTIKMNYDTPVLGAPWSIPFEVPVFQWITGLIVHALHTPLDQTGRVVSILFHLSTLIPLYCLLGKCRVAGPHRFLVLALLLASPFYTFWSRTFMMETCALFFCVSYLAAAAWAIDTRRIGWILLACGLGAIGALTKITTVLPFVALAGCFALWGRFGFKANLASLWKNLVLAALLTGAPMAAGVAWAHHADAVKLCNPMAAFITSGALQNWNFGGFAMKIKWQTWAQILGRTPDLFSVGNLFRAECLVALIVLACVPRRRKEIAICIALFLLSPAIITNLHYVHDYYMCANGIFLIAAAGFVIVSVAESEGWRGFSYVLCALAIIAGAVGHRAIYRPLLKGDEPPWLSLARKIRHSTPVDSVNIIAGFDWNPAVPYYSERRTLMLPDGGKRNDVRKAMGNLRNYKVGLVLVAPGSPWSKEWLVKALADSGIKADRVCLLDEAGLFR